MSFLLTHTISMSNSVPLFSRVKVTDRERDRVTFAFKLPNSKVPIKDEIYIAYLVQFH